MSDLRVTVTGLLDAFVLEDVEDLRLEETYGQVRRTRLYVTFKNSSRTLLWEIASNPLSTQKFIMHVELVTP